MLDISKVYNLHIECTSYCNARCPACPRSFCGYGVDVEPTHLSYEKIKNYINDFPNLNSISYCGNYGDPMMHPDIDRLTEFDLYYSIATNGSPGRIETYEKLAKKNVTMRFGIDGLQDTNHLYRQDVVWERVIERAKAFINSGGTAEWQFIVFNHNKHQIEKARQLSEQLGFVLFDVVRAGRDFMPALDRKGEISHWIKPANQDVEKEIKEYDLSLEKHLHKNPYVLEIPTKPAHEIDCETKRGSLYIDAQGNLLPCCYHGITRQIQAKGVTIQEKVDSFSWLEQTWSTKDCDETCYSACKR